jgi:hypothetical protein
LDNLARPCLTGNNERNPRLASQVAHRAQRHHNDLDSADFDELRSLFFGGRQEEARCLIGNMRMRWKLARQHEEYNQIEELLRRGRIGTGQLGRGFATIAEEHMFERFYEEKYNVYATKDTHLEQFAVFKKEIEKGRRWSILKSKFRSGIFAVLPSRTINNI